MYIFLYIAGENTAAECMGRDKYMIDGKEYDECGFCRASCPSRDIFKEPDSGLPLKCDMCGSDPPLSEPMCVQWCLNDALTYEEREEEGEEEAEAGRDGNRIGSVGEETWIAKGHGYRCPNGEERLNSKAK